MIVTCFHETIKSNWTNPESVCEDSEPVAIDLDPVSTDYEPVAMDSEHVNTDSECTGTDLEPVNKVLILLPQTQRMKVKILSILLF